MARIDTRVKLTGILSDPMVANQLKDALLRDLIPEAARLAALVRSKTPVADPDELGRGNPPPGSLRDGVKGEILPTKTGVTVKVTADRAMRQPTQGDSQRSNADRVAAQMKINERRYKRAVRKGIPYVPKELSGIGKAGKRHGPVPYGIFVDNKTGFLTDTLTEQWSTTMQAINDSVNAWVKRKNAEPVPRITLLSNGVSVAQGRPIME